MSHSSVSSDAPGVFPRTRWSVVVAARGANEAESVPALEVICRAYWQPLYSFARRSGHSPHDAQDLTQEFFSRLLAKRWLDAADQAKGRLRTFLIAAFKNFMHKEWRRESAQKRGGGASLIELDTQLAEAGLAALAIQLEPDELYDRQWALTLLSRTFDRLHEENAAAGRLADFEALKDCLMAGPAAIDYVSVAEKLGVNPGAARVAVHRLRKRFRQLYREELSQTLADEGDLEGEMRHLAAALGREM